MGCLGVKEHGRSGAGGASDNHQPAKTHAKKSPIATKTPVAYNIPLVRTDIYSALLLCMPDFTE